MATPTSAPSADQTREVRETLEIVKQLESDFQDRNKIYKELDDITYLKKPPRVPRGYPNTTKVQSPLAAHIVNTVTAALSMKPYKVLFDPVAIGPTGEQNASLREHFFDSSWQRQEQEKRRRIFRVLMHAAVQKGECVVKTIERSKRVWGPYDSMQKQLTKDLADPNHPEYGDIAKRAKDTGDYHERDRVYNARTEEAKRGLPYPIESTDVPPETFLYNKGEDGFTYCCEKKIVPYYSTLARYGRGLNGSGKVVPEAMGLGKNEWSNIMSGAKALTMYEAWDWQKVRYILCGPGDDAGKGQGELVKIVPHKYGIKALKTLRGPYFQAFGITSSSRENHLMGQSVLFAWRKLFPWLDELLTIQGAAAYQYGYPKYRRRGGGPEDQGIITPNGFLGRDAQDRIDREQDVEPGAILPWDIEPVNQPSSGPDLGEAIKICRDLIELCLPSVVQGLVNGDESGYLASQATHLARLVWSPIVDNTEFMLAERTSFEAWLIDQCIKEDVYVWGQEAMPAGYTKRKPKMMWLGIGPDELKGIYNFRVELQPSTPSEDVIKVRTHDEMLKLQLETLEMARADMGFSNEEVEFGLMLQQLKAMLLPDVLTQAKGKILANQQAAANRANEQEQNAPGGPGGPNNGRFGTGDVIQPGQNGEPIQPTPAGQAGVTDVSPAGGIGARPVTPSPAPASAERAVVG